MSDSSAFQTWSANLHLYLATEIESYFDAARREPPPLSPEVATELADFLRRWKAKELDIAEAAGKLAKTPEFEPGEMTIYLLMCDTVVKFRHVKEDLDDELKKAISTALRNCLGLADMAEDRLLKAHYLSAASEWHYRLGDREQTQHCLDAALALYEAMQLTESSLHDHKFGQCLRRAAYLLAENHRWAECLPFESRACEIYERLVQRIPGKHDADYFDAALVLVHALWSGDVGQNADYQVLHHLEKARTILAGMPAAERLMQEPAFGVGLRKTSDFLIRYGRWMESLPLARQACEIYECLEQSDASTYAADYAHALYQLGNALANCGELLEAVVVDQRSCAKYRRLSEQNPVEYAERYALALNNYANRLSETGEVEEALTQGKICRDLFVRMERESLPYKPGNFALVVGNLGNCYYKAGRFEEALAAARESCHRWGLLVKADDQESEGNYAQSLINVAIYFAELEMGDKAFAASKKATEILERLAAVNPGRFESPYGKSLFGLINRFGIADRYMIEDETTAIIEKASRLYEKLAGQNPALHSSEYAGVMVKQAQDLRERGLLEEALQKGEQACAIRAALATAQPNIHTPNYVSALDGLAHTLQALGRPAEALAIFQRMEALIQTLPQQVQDGYLDHRAGNYYSQALILRQRQSETVGRDLPGAILAMRRTIELREVYRRRIADLAQRRRVQASHIQDYALITQLLVEFALERDPADPEAQQALVAATEVIESTRCRFLLDMLGDENAAATHPAPELLQRYQDARRQAALDSPRSAAHADLFLSDVPLSGLDGFERMVEAASTHRTTPAEVRPAADEPRAAVRNAGDFGEAAEAEKVIAFPTAAFATDPEHAEALDRIRETSPAWDPDQPMRSISLPEIRSLLEGDEQRALVQFFRTPECSYALVITLREIVPILLPSYGPKVADGFHEDWLLAYYLGFSKSELYASMNGEQTPDHIFKLYLACQIKDARALRSKSRERRQNPEREQGWAVELSQLIERQSAVVIQPIAAALEARNLALGGALTRLILSPHLELHLFPLHACCVAPGVRLGDVCEVAYSPGFTLTHRSQARRLMTAPLHLITGGASADLAHSLLETRALERAHPQATVLRGAEVTRDRLMELLPEARSWIYSGHARHREDAVEGPLLSGLVFGSAAAEEQSTLTIRDIFRQLRFKGSPDITLIGCETHVALPDHTGDPVNIATAFLYAGARSVVSTLWRVDDLASALWSTRFQAERFAGKNVTHALRDAARWLRGDPDYPQSIRSGRDLVQRIVPWFLGEAALALADSDADSDASADASASGSGSQAPGGASSAGEDLAALREICLARAHELCFLHTVTPPFAHPYFWAPFVATGYVFSAGSH